MKSAYISAAERIESFARLGEILRAYPARSAEVNADTLVEAARLAYEENVWFTPEHITIALNAIGEILRAEDLSDWIAAYSEDMKPSCRTIGVVMAGNIPAVGFHDFLCVLISGNRILAKLSSVDKQLLPAMAKLLVSFNPAWEEFISFTTDRIEGFDAIIATGRNNTSRYFDYYFGKYPNIIRRNRNSLAVITGDETAGDLAGLSRDIFLYFGMGCRNVSKIFIPDRYDLGKLTNAFSAFAGFANHNKYRNNYDYLKSIYLINKVPFLDTGFLLIVEDPAIQSPIAVLHFERYNQLNEVTRKLNDVREEIQCVVSIEDPGLPYLLPGQAQYPALRDYADDTDTLKFLMTR